MTQQEFASMVRELCVYFEAPEPEAERLAQWWAELAPEPGGAALAQAAAALRREEPRLPVNLPRALRLRLPRPKRQERERTDCPRCRGEGFLFASRQGLGYAFLCAHCQDPARSAVPAATVEGLLAAGFTL